MGWTRTQRIFIFIFKKYSMENIENNYNKKRQKENSGLVITSLCFNLSSFQLPILRLLVNGTQMCNFILCLFALDIDLLINTND